MTAVMAKKRTVAKAPRFPAIAKKIIALRQALGENQELFGERFKVSQNSVSRWEFDGVVARKYQEAMAALAHMTVAEFFHSDEGPRIVPVLGIASDEHVAKMPRAEGKPIKHVKLQIGGENQVSIKVEGRSLNTAGYRDGDVVVGVKLEGDDLIRALNRDCIVQTAAGEMYVKVLCQGTKPGRYTLRSYIPGAPDVENVCIEWAAPVRWIGRDLG